MSRDPDTVHRWRHAGVGRVDPSSRLVQSTLVVAVLSLVHLLWPDGRFGQASYMAVTFGAAGVAWLSVRRFGGSPRIWLAAAITASALGDALFQVIALLEDRDPSISVADVAWVASYVGVSIAMLQLLRRGHRHTRHDMDAMIDAAVIVMVSVLLVWQFWLDPGITDTSVALPVRLVWASYPVLDAMLLALVLRAVIARRTRSAIGVLVGLGVTCWLVSDFAYLIFVPAGTVGVLLDVGWMAGAALLAVGCWRIPDLDRAELDLDQPQEQIGRGRVALALTPLLVPGVIELVIIANGGDPDPVPLLAATFAFAALAGVRMIRLLQLRDGAQARLAQSERRFRALAANSSDAVLVLDADGRITNDVPDLLALLGYRSGRTLGHRVVDVVPTSDVGVRQQLDDVLRMPGVVRSGEVRVSRRDGRDLWLSTRAVNLLDDPDVGGIVVNVHDITARKTAEEALVHQAFHDSLTGLANRALFRDRVEHALDRRARTGLDPAVIYLDLDGFKHVNDGLGHEAGDHLLCEVADRLQRVVRASDTVARLGGDEFAVLVEDPSGALGEAESIAARVLQSLTVPVALDGHVATLSASLGIATGQGDSTASSLLRDADVAMYQAKTSGRGRWVVYQPTMRLAAVERLQLENDLGRALEEEQFVLCYQPVVKLRSNRIVGFEALLRWQHPELGLVMPDAFIPLAEENGMIIPIGRWVLQTACHTAARWLDRCPHALTMGVNLSARQLASAELVRDVQEALLVAGLSAEALVLEMTETVLVQDAALAAARLHQLRDLGVRLAIDDFGTGYSSLSYLRQFQVDILKVDGSFVQSIVDRHTVPPLVRGVLDLGRTLQLEIVAEGIETEAQLELLRDQDCALGQGYLFARPLPAADAERLLADMSWVPT